MGRALIVASLAAAVLLASTATAQAEVVQNTSESIQAVVWVPCANGGVGEFVDLSGTLHVLRKLTEGSDSVSATEHFQPQGVRGVGESTGAVYEGTGVTRTGFTFSLHDGSGEQSYDNTFQLIGHGTAANFRVRQHRHLKLDANGQVTVNVDTTTVDCR
jgi:hypothetical protein